MRGYRNAVHVRKATKGLFVIKRHDRGHRMCDLPMGEKKCLKEEIRSLGNRGPLGPVSSMFCSGKPLSFHRTHILLSG